MRVACAALVAALVLGAPGSALGEGFVEDVPDSPLAIEAIELAAFAGGTTIGPDGVVDVPMLAPMEVQVRCNPASASFGVDCGMPDMCGLDPCLCGSADAWGACSCNGLEERAPRIECSSSDSAVVAVDERDGRILLRSGHPGSATVRVSAHLDHHDEAVAEFTAISGRVCPADLALIGVVAGVVALAAAVAIVVVVLRKRSVARKRYIHVPPMLLLGAAALLLCSCSASSVTDASPHVQDVAFKASSDMTESSQKAEVRITFDQPVSVKDDCLDDFQLLMNGSPLDESTVTCEARPDATGVTVVMRPAAGAQGVGKGSYFALYQADLSLSAKRDDGALPSITGADGSCAVLDEPIRGTFPSGLAVEEVQVVPGDAAAGQTAQTTFRVTSPATIRAVTWFSPDGGETLLLKHNHTFADASVEDCAADLAKVVNAESGLGISATAQGDTVVMRAAAVQDGQELHPVVVEGVGVQGGAFSGFEG